MKQSENEQSDTPIELSPDDLAFVAAYFECNMNATRAYMQLHPKATYESAKALASVTLTNVNLKAEIKRVLNEKAMSAEEAVARIGMIARSDHYPFIEIDEDGFVYFNFADPQAKAHLYLIKKIKTKRERRVDGKGDDAEMWEGEWVEVELHDAHVALRDILKMHGKLTDRVDLTTNGEPIQMPVEQIAQRVSQLLETARKRKQSAGN